MLFWSAINNPINFFEKIFSKFSYNLWKTWINKCFMENNKIMFRNKLKIMYEQERKIMRNTCITEHYCYEKKITKSSRKVDLHISLFTNACKFIFIAATIRMCRYPFWHFETKIDFRSVWKHVTSLKRITFNDGNVLGFFWTCL